VEFLQEPEVWVAIGLAVLLGFLIRAKVPGMALSALDAKAEKVKAELAEALRLRHEAEALLASIKTQRHEAEVLAAEMLSSAEEEVARMAQDAQAKLEEQIQRRQQMAERKIATAQVQAEADVRAAAVDLAAQIAETVLAARVAGLTSDPLVDRAVARVGDKLQ
jgi:F-type H+-transporting ATPase subunit b